MKTQIGDNRLLISWVDRNPISISSQPGPRLTHSIPWLLLISKKLSKNVACTVSSSFPEHVSSLADSFVSVQLSKNPPHLVESQKWYFSNQTAQHICWFFYSFYLLAFSKNNGKKVAFKWKCKMLWWVTNKTWPISELKGKIIPIPCNFTIKLISCSRKNNI